MKIAYVTTYDVFDSSTWSKNQVGFCGAGYYMAQSLANQSIELDYIGALQKKFSLVTRAKWSFYRNLLHQDYYRWAEPLVLKNYARQISKKLSALNSDIVLCPENAAPLAYLECKQPIVLWTDSTLAGLINFYPYLNNLCDETRNNIYAMEQAALNRCKLAIFLSDWAAQTAIKTYNIDPAKVKVIPWGANIECDRTIDDIQSIIASRTANPCKLLFIGLDWRRKGGDVAFEVARELNRIGLKTQLTVVGCKPTMDESPPYFVEVRGFIDKSTKEGFNQLNKLIAESHFLILPTVADCSPHVLIEGSSFGVPCLATNTGGIPSIIKDDVNGKVFQLGASISEYCNYILYLMHNYEEYKKLAVSSFNEYQSRLNWEVATQKVKELLVGLSS